MTPTTCLRCTRGLGWLAAPDCTRCAEQARTRQASPRPSGPDPWHTRERMTAQRETMRSLIADGTIDPDATDHCGNSIALVLALMDKSLDR